MHPKEVLSSKIVSNDRETEINTVEWQVLIREFVEVVILRLVPRMESAYLNSL